MRTEKEVRERMMAEKAFWEKNRGYMISGAVSHEILEWVLSGKKKEVIARSILGDECYSDGTKKEWRNKECVHYDENTSCLKCRNEKKEPLASRFGFGTKCGKDCDWDTEHMSCTREKEHEGKCSPFWNEKEVGEKLTHEDVVGLMKAVEESKKVSSVPKEKSWRFASAECKRCGEYFEDSIYEKREEWAKKHRCKDVSRDEPKEKCPEEECIRHKDHFGICARADGTVIMRRKNNPSTPEQTIQEVSREEQCEHVPSSESCLVYHKHGKQCVKCAKCGKWSYEWENVSREKKPKNENTPCCRCGVSWLNHQSDVHTTSTNILGNKYEFVCKQYKECPHIYSLAEVADLMEKIYDMDFGTNEDIDSFQINWPHNWARLFRERPDLVENFRKEESK